MRAPLHRIRRQRWVVHAAEDQAFAVRRWLRANCETELSEALAEAFDRAAPGEEVVRLGRLEIGLRVADVTTLRELLPARVAEALSERLKQNGSTPAASAPESRDDARVIEYLLTGAVTWPSRPDEPSTVQALAAHARSSAPRIAAALAGRARDRRALGDAMFRLLQLLDERDWPAAVRAAGGNLPSLHPESGLFPSLESHAETIASKDERLRGVVSALIGTPLRSRGSSMSQESTERGQAPAGPPATSSALSPVAGMRPPADSHPPAARHPERRQPIDALVSADLAVTRPRTPGAPDGRAEEAFATAVASAGLVLLHPFLPRFFESTGFGPILEWDPSSRQTGRAAALLHFVATGRDEPYELELGFIKILLGLDTDTPLPVAGGLLTTGDRDEALALLHAVVEHWQALKRSSIAAVRASFLQRPGLVKKDENGWRLQVEPGPFDVLLGRLPWSLAVVKLPWMHTPIHCEWSIR